MCLAQTMTIYKARNKKEMTRLMNYFIPTLDRLEQTYIYSVDGEYRLPLVNYFNVCCIAFRHNQ